MGSPPAGYGNARTTRRNVLITASPNVEELTDAHLRVFYDEGPIERGRAYADDERVSLLKSKPGSIQAICLGSGKTPYVVRIGWSLRGDLLALDDDCSCPMGGACKHCVATIIIARRNAEATTKPQTGPRAGAEWRAALVGLQTDDVEPSTTPLALCVTVQQSKPGRYGGGDGPRAIMRPLRMGKSGKWVKTGASWRDIDSPYRYGSDGIDERQRAAMRGLMSSGRIDHWTTTHSVALSQFGADLWYHLARAVEVGVHLVGDKAGDLVELSTGVARASIDLTADPRGAVALSTGFALGDRSLPVHDNLSGLVGNPPHGLWMAEGSTLHLIGLAEPLHPTVTRLALGGSLTVPPADVDELLDVYQPELALHANVESSDGTVAIVASRFERIVLTVERTALDTADLRWTARYRRGERVTNHSLHRALDGRQDRAAESAAITELGLPTDLFPDLVGPDVTPCDLTVSGSGLVTMLTDVLPRLEAEFGIAVELRGDQPALREATEDPLISLTVSDGKGGRDGNDWFDLDVDIRVDGQTVDFVSLFAALDRGDQALILASGTWLSLDRREFTRLRELIDEARGLAEHTGAGTARVNRFQTSWWDELAGLGIVAEQSQRWEQGIAQLAALTAPEPVDPPPALDATLRPYQQEGLDWLAFLYRNELGGVLADDMGLGKTIQTLALCLHILEDDPDARFLVVAPTSVVENWVHEVARFAPGVTVRTIRETESRRGTSLEEEIRGATIVVTSYALFRLEFEAYAGHTWNLLLLDEAQFVKNHQGKTYQCVRRLDARTKIAITGTPLENTLMDLWSLLSITAPGLFPDPKRFSDTYRKPIETGDAPELLATLRRRIAPLMLRRTKGAVLTDLPPKTEQIVEVELSPRHARIYATQLQRQRQMVLGLVGDVQKHRFEIFKSLTLLRQLALDPGLVEEEHDHIGSAKLDRLIEDLTQVVAEGHRALVFSQFTRYLARVRTRLDAASIDYSYLDGRTRKRGEAIARFKDGDAPVFVISLKAGGVGLNLTEADYCFVLDPWWNPATETQAVDRAHRIGQQNPVMVYRYVSVGTIEEKVMELKGRKADLFDSVMDDEGSLSGPLSEDDIRGLLDLD